MTTHQSRSCLIYSRDPAYLHQLAASRVQAGPCEVRNSRRNVPTAALSRYAAPYLGCSENAVQKGPPASSVCTWLRCASMHGVASKHSRCGKLVLVSGHFADSSRSAGGLTCYGSQQTSQSTLHDLSVTCYSCVFLSIASRTTILAASRALLQLSITQRCGCEQGNSRVDLQMHHTVCSVNSNP